MPISRRDLIIQMLADEYAQHQDIGRMANRCADLLMLSGPDLRTALNAYRLQKIAQADSLITGLAAQKTQAENELNARKADLQGLTL